MFSDDMKFLQKAVILHPSGDGRILILKRPKDSFSRPGEWDLSGGNVLFGETHDDSLRNEILEETGMEVRDISPLKVITRFDSESKIYQLTITYVCKAVDESFQLSKEHTEGKWATLTEIEEIMERDWLKEAVKMGSDAARKY